MAVDLHIHTTASDGSLSPGKIVRKAYEMGYSAIAITDHDTIDGINEAKSVGENIGLEVIPGIEINTEFKKHEVHILGYFIDQFNQELLVKLDEVKKARINRVKKIINKLNDINIDISEEEVFSLSDGGAVGRSHIARILHEKGYVNSFSEAFDKYIAIGKVAYVERYRLTPNEAIELIENAGGIPVLAHPALIKNDKIVKEIINMGVKGLESYYYEHDLQDTKKYLKIAKKNKLLITGGSDDHGPGNKDGLRLGKMKLDYNIVENLKESINLPLFS